MKAFDAVLAAAGLLSATQASAEWHPVSRGSSGTVWYLDPGRIKVVDGKVHVWAKLDHSQDASVKWRESKQLISVNCSANTSRILSYVNYDSYGKITSSQNFSDYSYGVGYDPIIPDSVMETVAKIACAVSSK